jgi:hypothetical protein
MNRTPAKELNRAMPKPPVKLPQQQQFVKVPAEYVDSLINGTLDTTSFAILVSLLRLCDWPTGVYKTCASKLAVDGNKPRDIRYYLEFLEDCGRIVRELPRKGSHIAYPILLNNYVPPVGENKGTLLRPVDVKPTTFSQWLAAKTGASHGKKQQGSRQETDTAHGKKQHPSRQCIAGNQDTDKINIKNTLKINQDDVPTPSDIEGIQASTTAEHNQDKNPSRQSVAVKEIPTKEIPTVETHGDTRLNTSPDSGGAPPAQPQPQAEEQTMSAEPYKPFYIRELEDLKSRRPSPYLKDRIAKLEEKYRAQIAAYEEQRRLASLTPAQLKAAWKECAKEVTG